MDSADFISVKAAAAAAGMDPTTVRRIAKRFSLTVEIHPKCWMLPKSAVSVLLREKRGRGNPHTDKKTTKKTRKK